MDKISIYCIQCGKPFDEYWGSLNWGHYGTCSEECKKKIHDRKHKIWKEDLKTRNKRLFNKD